MSQKYRSAIEAISDCAVACAHCASASLGEDDVSALIRCISTARECAAICHLAMDSLAARSELAKMICDLCAQICTACADECEKHDDMKHCRRCAEACRKCAEECSNLGKLKELSVKAD